MPTVVKVQLPVNVTLLRETGRAYADLSDPNVLIYDRAKKHFWQGQDDELRKHMFEAAHGRGYMKAFMLAEWHDDHWVIDYDLGFQPLQDW